MRVAVDARELAGRPTGVGRYLAALLDQWAASREARRHEWRLYAHGPLKPPDGFAPLEILPGRGGTCWEQWTFMRALARNSPDVLFAPGYTAPLAAPCPVALTVHDVSFTAHPEWFSRREGARRRMLTAWSARRARLVQTDSEFSKREIVRYFGIPPERIRVIPLGVSQRIIPEDAAASEAREPIVLYVGSIFARRHVDALIDAFVSTVAPQVPGSRLEIVGDNRLYPPGDPAAPLRTCPPDIARRVTLRAYVDDDTLRDLYRRASVFAFLSEYEGFGLTPLEALACGVAPVVLDTPVAREICGPAARYVTRVSRADIAAPLIELLTDATARQSLLAEARDVLLRYDWTQTAARTLAAIEEAAGA